MLVLVLFQVLLLQILTSNVNAVLMLMLVPVLVDQLAVLFAVFSILTFAHSIDRTETN